MPSNPETPIHAYISEMDHAGMRMIEDCDLNGFKRYLNETRNTICGRNPIRVLLALLQKSNHFKTRFVKYAQSSAVTSPQDSSVSYATAVVSHE
jgi:AmmeMemoRadiSam system protein B